MSLFGSHTGRRPAFPGGQSKALVILGVLTLIAQAEPDFWTQYGWRLIVFALLAAQTLLIFILLVERDRRRRTSRGLRESETRYRQMFVQNQAVQFLIDPKSARIVAANPAAATFYSYTIEQLEQMKITDINILPPDEVASSMARAASESRNHFIFPHRLASGEIRHVEVHSSPLEVGGRKLLYSIVHDITERRKTEERMRQFFDLPLVGMAITSPDRNFIFVNQKLCDMLGYTESELTGMSWMPLTHPDDVAENVRLLEQTLRGETDGYKMEKRFIHRDGHLVYTSISARCVRREDGVVDQLVLIVEDTTERKHAEAALMESQVRNRAILKAIPDMMFFLTRDGVYVDFHAPDEGELLSSPETFLGRNMRDVLPAELAERMSECFRRVKKPGDVQTLEYSLSVQQGERFYEARMVGCENDRVLSIVRDVTERKHAEEELRQLTSRLLRLQDEERRRIAGELHDVTAQNLLAMTLGLAEVQRQPDGLSEDVRNALARCQTLGRQSLQEIRTLSYLLHPPLLDEAGLVSAVRWYTDGFGKRSGIDVELIAPRDLGRLSPDIETALFRVVQECLTNIYRHSGSKAALIRLARDTERVVLIVKDDGCGIEGQDNKESSQNGLTLGVGIPGMRQRLLQLGGKLEIKSDARGTTVTAFVPQRM